MTIQNRKLWIGISATSLLITLAGSMTLFYLFDLPAIESGNIGATFLITMIPFGALTAYALSKLIEEKENDS